jgi:hypothetical protein
MRRWVTRRDALRAPGRLRRGHLYPFHLDSFNNGECTNDINHSWSPQHSYWDGGRMDGFVRGHLVERIGPPCVPAGSSMADML